MWTHFSFRARLAFSTVPVLWHPENLPKSGLWLVAPSLSAHPSRAEEPAGSGVAVRWSAPSPYPTLRWASQGFKPGTQGGAPRRVPGLSRAARGPRDPPFLGPWGAPPSASFHLSPSGPPLPSQYPSWPPPRVLLLSPTPSAVSAGPFGAGGRRAGVEAVRVWATAAQREASRLQFRSASAHRPLGSS